MKIESRLTEKNTLLELLGIYLKRLFITLCIVFFCSGIQLFAETYPDLLSINAPSDLPILPAGMDTFLAPVDTQTPDTDAPQLGEWTRTGTAGDVLAITGYNLSYFEFDDIGKDIQFVVYGQTTSSNGQTLNADILRLDGDLTSIILPSGLPAWSTYLVWGININGASRPAIINATEGWWVGPSTAKAGSTVAAYGRNLSHDNSTVDSWIYIQPSSGTGQWVTPTAVNPYKVDFVVPSGLSNGDYEIWVHNGHGGDYGWSQAGTLTVDGGMPWTSNTYDVTDYGAIGDGTTDDTDAIKDAYIAARQAGEWNTVYFPAGTYAVTESLAVQSEVRWLGDGMASTIIKTHADWDITTNWSLLHNGGSNNEVKDLTLLATSDFDDDFLVYRRDVENIHFTNVKFDAPGHELVDIHMSNSVYFTDCEFIGKHSFLGNASQVFIDGCDFYATDDALSMVLTWGGDEISMTNSTCQDLDNSDPDDPAGWGQGRFFTGNGIWGSGVNTYLGGNTTYDLAVRTGRAGYNTGEQFMWEGNNNKFFDNPTAATATTVTFSDVTDLTGKYLTITSGKGIGQFRLITEYNATTKTLTVDKSFNITPDGTSMINIGDNTVNLAIYNNTFDGKSNYDTYTSASAGIEPYGGCLNVVATNNTMTELRQGISAWGMTNGIPAGIQPTYWGLYADNEMTDMNSGIVTKATTATGAPGTALLGNIFRNTTIYNVANVGIAHGYSSAPSEGAALTIFDDITITNTAVGVDLVSAATDIILYNNDFSRGTATYTGSQGIEFDFNQQLVLRENTWLNFETTYDGSIPGAILEVPKRFFEAEAISGSSTQISLPVWNAGTSSLSWTISDNVDWLTVSTNSGSVSVESDYDNITLTCTAKSYLEAGMHTAVVSLSDGINIQRVTVNFTVTGTPLPAGQIAFSNDADYDDNFKQTASGKTDMVRNSGGYLSVNSSSSASKMGYAAYDTSAYGGVDGSGGTNGSGANNDIQDAVISADFRLSSLTSDFQGRLYGRLDDIENAGTPNPGGYNAIFNLNSSTEIQLRLYKGASLATTGTSIYNQTFTLTGGTTVSANTWYTMQMEMNGSAFTLSILDSLGTVIATSGTISDSTKTTAGQVGVGGYAKYTLGNGEAIDIDNFNISSVPSDYVNINFSSDADYDSNFKESSSNKTAMVRDSGGFLNLSSSNANLLGTAAYDTSATGGLNGNGGTGGSDANNNIQDATILLNIRVSDVNSGYQGRLYGRLDDGEYDGTPSPGGYNAIFSFNSATELQLRLYKNASIATTGTNIYNQTFTLTGGATVSADTWYTMMLKMDGNELTMSLLDSSGSVLATSGAVTNTAKTSAGQLGIGAYVKSGDNSVDLDDFRISLLPSIVSLSATDSSAAETSANTGTFTFTRTNPIGELRVKYTISGTADDSDYDETLTGYVVFADGNSSKTLLITPNNDGQQESSETLILTLASDEDYIVGSQTSGTVTITD